MNLWIDGRQVEAVPGERLLDAVRRLGLDHPELSRRPLAARIAGETFTLNYVPQREEQEDPACLFPAAVRAPICRSSPSSSLRSFPPRSFRHFRLPKRCLPLFGSRCCPAKQPEPLPIFPELRFCTKNPFCSQFIHNSASTGRASCR